jgi:hypothetical protein
MGWKPETFEYVVGAGDVVELVIPSGLGSPSRSDVVAFLKDEASTFPEYLVPYYPDQPRMRQIGDRHWAMVVVSGGQDERRLIILAGLNRPFDWSHDPRFPG